MPIPTTERRGMGGSSKSSSSSSSSSSPRDPHLSLIHLWGIAVGSAIGGDFVGWNSTLVSGLGGALVGLGISTALYLSLSLCIAEMSAHCLKIGGPHTFVAESPLGRLGAYMTGVAELLKIVPTGAVCVFAIAAYVGHGLELLLGSKGGAIEAVIWVLAYVLFTALNIVGIELSVNVQLTITVSSLAVLVAFYVPALGAMDFHRHALMGLGEDGWFMGNYASFFISLPYSLWWYLGIESVPLLAGSVKHPARVMPRAIVVSMATLAVAAILTLLLNSSVAPGVAALQHSSAPLLDGFKALTSSGPVLTAVSFLVSLGLIVSFHCFVLYAGETVATLACDGILPAWLGATHPQYDTPHLALAGSSALGLALLGATLCTMAPSKALSVLINVAVVGGLVAYTLQYLAYLSRPWGATGSGFKSPLGRPGAYVGLALCVLLMCCEVYHASQEIAEAEGLLLALTVFGGALAVYHCWPTSRWGKAARAARTHADSLEDGQVVGKAGHGVDADYADYALENGGLSSLLPSSSTSSLVSANGGAAVAASPGRLTSAQRRRGGASASFGGGVVSGLQPVQGVVMGAGGGSTGGGGGGGGNYAWCDV